MLIRIFRPILPSSRNVSLYICLYICPLFMSTFSRPLIGPPQPPWFSQGLPGVFHGFSRGFPGVFFLAFPKGFPGFSPGFPRAFPGFSRSFPGVFPGFARGFPRVFPFFSSLFFKRNNAISIKKSKIVSVLLSASVKRFFVSRRRFFSFLFFKI